MTSLEVSSLHQKAVLWTEATTLDNEGDVTLNAATEIDVRVERKRKQSKTAQANPVATDLRVWVDREITIGSIIWIGTLQAWNALSAEADLKQVIAYDEIPDIKGRKFERVVMLQKYSNSLPSLA